MKKFSILFAALALMAMTACNEKPSKNAEGTEQPAPTEQVDTTKGNQPKVQVERAKPTEDGKDHTVAEFKTDKYQVKLENLADGTFRLTLGEGGNANQVVETKNCVMQGGNYLMKADDGKVYVITNKENAQQLTIMTDKEILYNGKGGK